MRSAFSYYGGKSRLANKIIEFIPNHISYIEPFCGAASVLFGKNFINHSNYVEVLNDNNSYLINFYKVLIDKKEQLIVRLENTPYSREIFYESKEIWRNQKDYNDIDLAWSFFTHIEQAFGSKLNAGWGISRNYATNKSFHNKVIELNSIVDRLKNVYIENLDALDCINKWDIEGGFFYVDPPYVGTDCGHYSGYKEENFKELIYTLKHCKSSFILSSYENELLPNSWKKEYIEHECIINKKRIEDTKRLEVLSYVDRSKLIKSPKTKEYAKRFGELIRKV